MLTSLASISHVTERAPVGFDSAPYFAALLASSWIAKANASPAFAKRVELGFELRVEHVPDHRHTGRPLGHAAEVRVTELRHPPASATKSHQNSLYASGDIECSFAKWATNSPSDSAITKPS
jgi:hypothetical protein